MGADSITIVIGRDGHHLDQVLPDARGSRLVRSPWWLFGAALVGGWALLLNIHRSVLPVRDLARQAPAHRGLLTGLFKLLVGEYLGAERAPVEFVTDGRTLSVGRYIQGAVTPIAGARQGEEVSVVNTQYWMGPEVTVAEATMGRVRAFGRVWNFEGRSAEICNIHWEG